MNRVPDFSDNDLWIIKSTLQERYGEAPDVQLAETELRLDLSRTELSTCPAAYWEVEGCHFVIAKTGDNRYRCQFFYRVHQMYGTGRDEYDDLTECVVTLLQVQADQQVKDAGEAG
ncbi:MAG TPA: hypothetical protein ENJ11_01965 [Gammaproteobacteria bacterium]|nr:hypothetical protein [Gammaproteobacteria bacterium]